ncbi:MAG: hypothetical protein LBO70_06330 [Clostridiales Family XIII bacterium]|nr:hypothetical protein [Clostridiales Family XIII bacterium]
MLVGVKFCGGCNPGYDRRAAYEKIRRNVMACSAARGAYTSFEPAREGVLYDALLVLVGCANRCASIAEYRATAPPMHVWNEAKADEASQWLTGVMSEDNAKREKNTHRT